MKRRTVIFGALALSMTLFTACNKQEKKIQETTAAVSSTAAAVAGKEASFSNFTAITLDGETVTQDIFQDHDLTMINIWATFCGPCLSEMPDLGEIHEEYNSDIKLKTPPWMGYSRK